MDKLILGYVTNRALESVTREDANRLTHINLAFGKVKDGLLADYITVVWYGDGGCSVSTGHFGFDSPDELRG